MSAIDLLAVEAFFQERPDRFVVFGGECEVTAAPLRVAQFLDEVVSFPLLRFAAGRSVFDFVIGADMLGQFAEFVRFVPVHPVAETLRLLGLTCGELEDSLFALVDKLVDAELGDIVFRAEIHFLLDFHLDPQTLAIEAVLITEFVAGHRKVALIGVFVRAAPRVMHAHRVIGGNRAVEKTPLGIAGIFLTKFPEDVLFVPEFEHLVLAVDETCVLDFLEHGRFSN